MDINASSLIASTLAQGQQNAGLSALKNTAKQEQQAANIIANAIEEVSAAGSNGRGANLDITV